MAVNKSIKKVQNYFFIASVSDFRTSVYYCYFFIPRIRVIIAIPNTIVWISSLFFSFPVLRFLIVIRFNPKSSVLFLK